MNDVITINQNSEAIIYLASTDKNLKQAFDIIGPISYQLYSDPYAFLVETIIGQMLSNKVADVLCGRLKNKCSGVITPDTIKKLSAEELRSLGVSNAKAKYIQNLTESVCNGVLDLSTLNTLSDNEVLKTLTTIHGIGNWSAKMFLIFVLGREDVLPFEDGAFLQAYSWLYKTDQVKKVDIENRCKKWKPYSSIAARYLYRLLDEGYTK
ncbi:MAG: DNA-3-methyladenine glycosylase 2 family protein [Bacillota bacterium]